MAVDTLMQLMQGRVEPALSLGNTDLPIRCRKLFSDFIAFTAVVYSIDDRQDVVRYHMQTKR